MAVATKTRKKIARTKTTPATRQNIADAAAKTGHTVTPLGGENGDVDATHDLISGDENASFDAFLSDLAISCGLGGDDFEDAEDGENEAEDALDGEDE